MRRLLFGVLVVACNHEHAQSPAAPTPPVAREAKAPPVLRSIPPECASAPPFSAWVESAPYTSDVDRHCAGEDRCEWSVSTSDAGLVVAPRHGELESPFASFASTKNDVHSKRVVDGWLLAVNGGEFGADVFWFSQDLRARKRIGSDNIVAIVGVADEIWLFAGLDHIMLKPGKVYRAEHAGAQTWTLLKVADLEQSAYAAAADGDGALVVTTTRLVRVHRDGHVEKLFEDQSWLGLYPQSMVVDQGRILIGARHAGIRLTPRRGGYDEAWLVRPTYVHPHDGQCAQ